MEKIAEKFIWITTATPSHSERTDRIESVSYLLPIFILGAFLAVLAATLLIACCVYHRFKAQHPAPTVSWKGYGATSTSRGGPHGGYYYDPGTSLEEGGAMDDEEYQARLLASRRRSTSYYDTNRSRAPQPVIIRHDPMGRPISTWSTASSVTAQRGEELSQWNRRRDDLLKIYGRSHNLSSHEDLDEEPEQESMEYQGQGQGLSQEQAQAPGQQTSHLEVGTVAQKKSNH